MAEEEEEERRQQELEAVKAKVLCMFAVLHSQCSLYGTAVPLLRDHPSGDVRGGLSKDVVFDLLTRGEINMRHTTFVTSKAALSKGGGLSKYVQL